MKTFLNIKTNQRLPEHGCNNVFDFEKNKYFIRGKGWLKLKKKEWQEEEIPDLNKNYTNQEWRDYAIKYGTDCAQEFLETCDYMKPSMAYRMFNPPKNQETWENDGVNQWFKTVFNRELSFFIDGYLLGLANCYSLDILKFEKFLAYEFGYPKDQDGSMNDFMVSRFGKETVDKFLDIFIIF